MAKVFLDANVFIDLVEGRKTVDTGRLATHSLFLSPLSIHILTYLYKYKMPHSRMGDIDKFFKLIPITAELTAKALGGPTADFEDNLQLQSAREADCTIFLTTDKKLLALKVFDTMQIASKLG